MISIYVKNTGVFIFYWDIFLYGKHLTVKYSKSFNFVLLVFFIMILFLSTLMYLDKNRFTLISTKKDTTRQQLRALLVVLKNYKADIGTLPSSKEGLDILIRNSTDSRYPQDTEIIYDAWGNKFVYHLCDKRNSFLLYSIGQNSIDELGQGDDILVQPVNTNTLYPVKICPTHGKAK